MKNKKVYYTLIIVALISIVALGAYWFSSKKSQNSCENVKLSEGIPDSVLLGQNVSFGVVSEDNLAVIWYFGDGDSAVGPNVEHAFAKEGTMQVLCIIVSQCTLMHTVFVKYVDESEPLLPDISGAIQAKSVVKIEDSVHFSFPFPDNAKEWEWDFSDTSSTLKNVKAPVHVYHTPGKRTVRLTIDAKYAKDFRIHVKPAPPKGGNEPKAGEFVSYFNQMIDSKKRAKAYDSLMARVCKNYSVGLKIVGSEKIFTLSQYKTQMVMNPPNAVTNVRILHKDENGCIDTLEITEKK